MAAASRVAPTAAPREVPARVILAALRVNGSRHAVLVEGTIHLAGNPDPVPHCWVEDEDRVHDPSQEPGRRIWPRELYYMVFRAEPGPRRAA